MKNLQAILISISLILILDLLCYIISPFVFFSGFAMTGIAAIIYYETSIKFSISINIAFIFILINDFILNKILGNPKSDDINIILVAACLGFAGCFALTFVYGLTKNKLKETIIGLIPAIFITLLYFYFFNFY